ncbi:hypothetical protein O9G_002992 [Rozella allomycis CSF55]|uniref:Uncharacterized protein n=1 Tax=Rozella allomycis (strain CSF55) TaxID=988480 RepID=A0A075AZY6_ROZAC|nr:hypothetical protein O9G_002992 [Rozella allomycis CSF55]|eukprot:EPZ34272.1 hypothetical protein O9G_002992 [Rozella allomycis CSF55]
MLKLFHPILKRTRPFFIFLYKEHLSTDSITEYIKLSDEKPKVDTKELHKRLISVMNDKILLKHEVKKLSNNVWRKFFKSSGDISFNKKLIETLDNPSSNLLKYFLADQKNKPEVLDAIDNLIEGRNDLDISFMNKLLEVAADKKDSQRVQNYICRLKQLKLPFDSDTYEILLNWFISKGELMSALQLGEEMLRNITPTTDLYNKLLNLYKSLERRNDMLIAYTLMDERKVSKNIETINIMISDMQNSVSDIEHFLSEAKKHKIMFNSATREILIRRFADFKDEAKMNFHFNALCRFIQKEGLKGYKIEGIFNFYINEVSKLGHDDLAYRAFKISSELDVRLYPATIENILHNLIRQNKYSNLIAFHESYHQWFNRSAYEILINYFKQRKKDVIAKRLQKTMDNVVYNDNAYFRLINKANKRKNYKLVVQLGEEMCDYDYTITQRTQEIIDSAKIIINTN